MAKGQKRGNREIKKPKTAKKADAAVSSVTSVAQVKRPAAKGPTK